MICNFTVNARTPFNMRLNLSEALLTEGAIMADAARGRLHDSDAANVMLRAVEPGDLIVDVGAHSGFFAVMCAHLVGSQGHVVCLEPEPENASRLRANLALNYLVNVTVIEKAAAEFNGVTDLFRHPQNDGGHGLWDVAVYCQTEEERIAGTPPRAERLRVEACTLDDALQSYAPKVPKLIKIDVEGAEHHVLKGARSLLTERRTPLIIAELHNFALESMGTSQIELRDYMREFGYETFVLYDNGGLPKLIPHGVQLLSRRVCNLLFARTEDVAPLWPTEIFDPGAASAD